MAQVKIEADDLADPSTKKEILAWNDYEINSSLFNAADAFTVEITPKPEWRKFFYTAGHKCRVYLDNELQMTGLLDTIQKSSSGDALSLTLSGRDYGGLLVDDTPPMITYYNRSMKQLIETLIVNHGAYITETVTDNAANRFIVSGKSKKVGKKSPVYRGITAERDWSTRSKPGEKIWDVINHMAEEIASHVWMSADGKLVIARPQYKQDPDIYGEGLYQITNKAGELTRSNCHISWDPSIADRFSHWNVTGQGTPKASAQGKTLSDHYNKARDPSPGFYTAGINRFHKENNLSIKNIKDNKMMRRMARTRMEKSIIDSYDMKATVFGHRPQPDAPLYTVDTMINVKLDTWGVNRPHYIIGRVFRNDASNGETTELDLIPPDIWLAHDHDSLSDTTYLDKLTKAVNF
jgi:prophage tail gpP-like protein